MPSEAFPVGVGVVPDVGEGTCASGTAAVPLAAAVLVPALILAAQAQWPPGQDVWHCEYHGLFSKQLRPAQQEPPRWQARYLAIHWAGAGGEGGGGGGGGRGSDEEDGEGGGEE